MCGIAGKMALVPGALVDPQAVRAMTAALAHRGPGGPAHHFEPGVGLGWRRCTEARDGQEPQVTRNDRGTIRVVGDFAITNAGELAAELAGAGRRLCSRAAADVVVHAYEQWGEDFVHRLRGAFACAVWDAARQTLLLARDPLGIKPLVYAITGNAVCFASEIKALLRAPDVPRDWDPAAVQEHLALGYVPAPATLLRGVSKLESGHIAVAANGRVHVREYWDLAGAATPPAARDADRLAAAARDAIGAEIAGTSEAVVMLSGGESSAAVGAIAAAIGAEQVTSVTVGFDEAPFTEVSRARQVAKALGLRHHTELSTPRLPELLPRLAWHLDEPSADPSAVTMYLACAAARQHSSRVLAGHGGRQVVGGDPPARNGFLRRLRLPARPSAIGQAAPGMTNWNGLRRVLDRDFVSETCWFDPLDALRAISAGCRWTDRPRRGRYLQLKASLPDHVLASLDRISASLSLEVRLPLLDRQVVEAAETMPLRRWALARRVTPLQALSARLLPASIVRPAHESTDHRVAAWLRGPLAPLMSDVLLSGRFRQRGVFKHKAVTRLWQQHLTGRRDHHAALWLMLMLELWFEQFVDAGSRLERAA
jgi:asparagine synthase (glutamine-hydrolysing)